MEAQGSTTVVVAAQWLCAGPWVTARSAMPDTFFPLVTEKALLSILLRPWLPTEPHMPGLWDLVVRPMSHSKAPTHTHSGERAKVTQQIGLDLG